MPLFVCDKCKAIENTACGCFWTCGRYGNSKDALCSECMPFDGYNKGGKWHNKFKKVTATAEEIKKIGEDAFVYVSDVPGVKAGMVWKK